LGIEDEDKTNSGEHPNKKTLVLDVETPQLTV
jgi:hypothetical protein